MIRYMMDNFLHRWLRIPYSLNVHNIRRPKHPRATILFIHGIGNTGAAWDSVIARIPDDVRIVAIDLLGFGESPRPSRDVYNAKTQARSVMATYFKLRILSPVIVVGHSLGALVAIEMAKRYPLLIKSIILCSPPLYNTAVAPHRFRIKNERLLRRFFRSVKHHPEDFLKLSAIAMKYNLINKSFNVTDKNIDSFIATLESMIINQTSYDDAHGLKTPVHILRGTLDPLVIKGNLQDLEKSNPNIRLSNIIAGHELRGPFVGSVVKAINKQLS
jgi:cis-3-alkyl-4-acyloxetan-2-one decarboxylase